MEEFGAQPVKYRHEIVDDDLNTMGGKILQGLTIVGDVNVTRRLTKLNVFMNVHRFNDFAF